MGEVMIAGILSIFAGIWIFYKRRKFISGSTIYEAEIVEYCSGNAFLNGRSFYTVQFTHNGKVLKKESDISRYFSPEKLVGKHVSIYYNENGKPQTSVRKKTPAVSVAAISFIVVGIMFLLSSGI